MNDRKTDMFNTKSNDCDLSEVVGQSLLFYLHKITIQGPSEEEDNIRETIQSHYLLDT